jgi:hypothetical protein
VPDAGRRHVIATHRGYPPARTASARTDMLVFATLLTINVILAGVFSAIALAER